MQYANAEIAEKDLAILFEKTTGNLVTATANFNSEELPSETWYFATQKAFSIGEPYQGANASKVFERQNARAERANVSTRVAPCEPLGVAPFQKAAVLWMPEVRLVMQLVTPLFKGTRYFCERPGNSSPLRRT